MEEELTYIAATAELDRILAELRSDRCDIDTLAARTRRAVELLRFCRSRLTATEDELRGILESLQTPGQ